MGVFWRQSPRAFTRVIRPHLRLTPADVLNRARIWFKSSGQHGASPLLLVDHRPSELPEFSHESNVFLRQCRRFGATMALRGISISPSPSALIPVLSIRRFSGTLDPRYGKLHVSVRWGDIRLLEVRHCPVQSTNCNRLCDKPSCLPKRHTKPKTFQRSDKFEMAALLNCCCRPARLPLGRRRSKPSQDQTRIDNASAAASSFIVG